MFRLNRVFIGLFGLAFGAIAVDNGLHSRSLSGIVLPAIAALWLLTVSLVGPRHRVHGMRGCRGRGIKEQPATPA